MENILKIELNWKIVRKTFFGIFIYVDPNTIWFKVLYCFKKQMINMNVLLSFACIETLANESHFQAYSL